MRFQGGFTLSETLEACGAFLKSPAAQLPDFPAHFQSLDDPEQSGPQSLTVVGKGLRLEVRQNLQAALILAEESVSELPQSIPVVRVTQGRAALSALIHALASRIEYEVPFVAGEGNVIGDGAVVEGVLEGNVWVGAGAYVGPRSFVGNGTRIEPRAVVLENSHLGPHCVVQSGAVIGSAGFGFLEVGNTPGKDAGELKAMPHLAGVKIGAHCFIGANTVIAGGVLHPTEIGEGCKLDSHVQVAHNVRLGRNGLLASQSGIAGSTTIGEGLRMGGAASVAGHLRLGRNVSVAACSGVTKDVPDNSGVAGFPAQPIREWRKQQIFLKNKGKEST